MAAINIPTRENGQQIKASWFNRLRDYVTQLFRAGKTIDEAGGSYYVDKGDTLLLVKNAATVYLPQIGVDGQDLVIKNVGENDVYIYAGAGQSIDGVFSTSSRPPIGDIKLSSGAHQSVHLHADGGTKVWQIIGGWTEQLWKTNFNAEEGAHVVELMPSQGFEPHLKLTEPLDIQNCRLRFSDESQKLEYSTDKGVTWNKVEGSGGGGGSASTPFAINSGYAENGHNAIMSGVGTNTINFNTTVPIKVTTASGKTGELVKVDPVTVSNDGTFNVFVDAVTGNVRLYANKVFIQSETPTAENNFDIWLDTTVEPMTLKIWSGSAWVENDGYIWFGSVTVTGGNVAVVKNKFFNINPITQTKWTPYENYQLKFSGSKEYVSEADLEVITYRCGYTGPAIWPTFKTIFPNGVEMYWGGNTVGAYAQGVTDGFTMGPAIVPRGTIVKAGGGGYSAYSSTLHINRYKGV